MRTMKGTRFDLHRHFCWLALALSGALVADVARAQKVESSASQALFEEARQLMLDDRLGEACPKFAESLHLEPALGTLLNLALCHEKQGKSATAYLEYTDAVAQAAREGESDRQNLAQQRLSALEPRVIRLSVRLAFAPPKELWVKLDGTRLEAAALSVALPVDPGTHAIEYGAPGKRPRVVSISVNELDLRPELSLGELEALRTSAPVAATRLAPNPPRGSGSDKRSIATGVLLGGGAAALAFGIFAGAEAGLEWAKRDDHCKNGCTQEAKTFGDNARQFARLSNISFAVGLAAAGAGIYLFATRPRDAAEPTMKVTATALPGQAALSLSGDL